MTIVTHEDLQQMTGLKQTAAIRRVLKKKRIPFDEHAGRLWTTTEAVSAKLFGRARQRKGPNFDAIAPKSPSTTR